MQTPDSKSEVSFLNTVRRVFSLGKPFARTIAYCMMLILVSTAIHLSLPIGVQRLFDKMLVARQVEVIHSAAWMLLLVFVIRAVLSYFGSYMLQVVGDRIVILLRKLFFSHLHSLDLAFHHSQRVGDLMSRLSNDVGAISNIVAGTAVSLVVSVLQLIGAAVVMVGIDWRLAAVVLAVAPMATLVSLWFSGYFRSLSEKLQSRLAQSASLASESLYGVEVVKLFGRERVESEKYDAALDGFMDAIVGARKIDALYNSIVAFITSLSVIAIFWYGGVQVVRGHLSAGTLVAFLLYSQYLTTSIASIGQTFSAFNRIMGSTKRVFEIMDIEPAVRTSDDPMPMSDRSADIRFEHVSFSYRDGCLALSDVSFDVKAGETVAIVGASGSGKSTLMKLVPRLMDPTEGAVLISGVDIRSYDTHALRHKIAIVSQDVFLFATSIRENIRLGRPEATENEVEAAAIAANAHEFILSMPEGYDTWVGERGIQLSGGQRQRISIARALLKDASILLLDEATSSVDNAAEESIQRAIENLSRGRTTIIVAHRLRTVRKASRIFVMSAGRIVSQPSYEELIGAHMPDLQQQEGVVPPIAIDAFEK